MTVSGLAQKVDCLICWYGPGLRVLVVSSQKRFLGRTPSFLYSPE